MPQTNSYDRSFIIEQILRYHVAMSVTQGRDCLWRIARHSNLFSLSPLEDLSRTQQQQVLSWLQREGFKV